MSLDHLYPGETLLYPQFKFRYPQFMYVHAFWEMKGKGKGTSALIVEGSVFYRYMGRDELSIYNLRTKQPCQRSGMSFVTADGIAWLANVDWWPIVPKIDDIWGGDFLIEAGADVYLHYRKTHYEPLISGSAFQRWANCLSCGRNPIIAHTEKAWTY